MEILNIRSEHFLKTISGKCVCVQPIITSSAYQLMTGNLQGKDPENGWKVTVYDIAYGGTKKVMAFCFLVENKAFFPVVTKNEFKCEELKFPSKEKDFPVETFNETFLFQWGERGTSDWRSLKSVADPNMYLFIEDNENANPKVTINPNRKPSFRIV